MDITLILIIMIALVLKGDAVLSFMEKMEDRIDTIERGRANIKAARKLTKIEPNANN